MQATCKNREKRKKHANDFSTLSIDDVKTKKKQICFVGIKILSNSQNTTMTQKTPTQVVFLQNFQTF